MTALRQSYLENHTVGSLPEREAVRMKSSFWYGAAIAGMILAAVLRSAWATRLDGFTIDEPWSIVAGVSHARNRDYRLDAEQGPLFKLWAGAFFDTGPLRLPPLRKTK